MLEKEGFSNNMKLIDTLRVSRHLLADLPFHRLQYLRYALEIYKDEQQESKKLGIAIKAHDAIGDVLVMKLLLRHLVKITKEKYQDKNPMEMLATLSNQPVEVKKFRFGKYKDRLIKDIASEDIGYLSWMRDNMKDLDDDLRWTLELYLN